MRVGTKHTQKTKEKIGRANKSNTYCAGRRLSNPKLDATKIPTDEDIAWAAGMYEGEGTVSGGNLKKSGQSIAVRINQDLPFILQMIRDWFGGSIGASKKKNGELHYCVRLCGDRARMFLWLIYERLSPRRKAQIPLEIREKLESRAGVMPNHVADYGSD